MYLKYFPLDENTSCSLKFFIFLCCRFIKPDNILPVEQVYWGEPVVSCFACGEVVLMAKIKEHKNTFY